MKIPKDIMIGALSITPPKTYNDLLKDPKWLLKRTEIIKRDNATCQICGSKDVVLNVHHIVYFPNMMPWEYPNDLLLTLCQPCHKREWAEWLGISYMLLGGTRLAFRLSDLGKRLAMALMWWIPSIDRELHDDTEIYTSLIQFIASTPEARTDLIDYVLQHDTTGLYNNLHKFTTQEKS